ncbi:MAG TPA: leucine-rich repeat domain-containing protein [Candidatus Nanoarchaeia archaeon]|nr:leucine-rich repeat domain-containing protein [Candidatus Nanoarchaeia archaeon]
MPFLSQSELEGLRRNYQDVDKRASRQFTKYKYIVQIEKQDDSICIRSNKSYLTVKFFSILDFLYKPYQWVNPPLHVYFNEAFQLNQLISRYEQNDINLEVNDYALIKSIKPSKQIKSIKINHQGADETEELSESIKELKGLKNLSITNKKLIIPKWINELSELESITLTNNNISYLPESICSLTKLRELKIENNQLTTLPEEINKLENLPDSTGDLKAIIINVNNNILCHFPKGLLKFAINSINNNKIPLELVYTNNNPFNKKGYNEELLKTLDVIINNGEVTLNKTISDFYEELRKKVHPKVNDKIII